MDSVEADFPLQKVFTSSDFVISQPEHSTDQRSLREITSFTLWSSPDPRVTPFQNTKSTTPMAPRSCSVEALIWHQHFGVPLILHSILQHFGTYLFHCAWCLPTPLGAQVQRGFNDYENPGFTASTNHHTLPWLLASILKPWSREFAVEISQLMKTVKKKGTKS